MTLFDSQVVSLGTSTETSAARRPRKQGWLPLLTILFLFSYGLMTMLIVEQGSTIESQRALIRELFRDSQELSAAKMKAQQNVARSAQTQAAPNHVPSTQEPSSKAPSSQADQQPRTQNKATTQKPHFKMPSKPASELVDVRTLNTI